MPLLNFMPQFVEPIRAGIKHHTIRAHRKIPVRKGDKLYLYCGARHPGAFRILPEPQECSRVEDIQVRVEYNLGALQLKSETALINGTRLTLDEREMLAVSDGFTDWNQMRWFWIKTHGKNRRVRGHRMAYVEFDGTIIHWK